jgi:hypothetical protein
MYFEPTDELNELLDNNAAPVDAFSIWEVKHHFDVAGEIDALIASVNDGLSSSRKVQRAVLLEVLDRAMERNAHAFASAEVFEMLVMREVYDFANSAVSGDKPSVTDSNNDLLPFGHPHSAAKFENYSEDFVREHQIEWKSSDPRVSEEFRPLVASAMRAPKNSLEQDFIVAKLEATKSEDVPRDVILSIISDNQ